jgi:uncharacterized protein (DUF433 family)
MINNYSEFIEQDYKIILGKPHIKGTRIAVELILRKLSEGATVFDILEMYPNLKAEHIFACLEYAASLISNEELIEYN